MSLPKGLVILARETTSHQLAESAGSSLNLGDGMGAVDTGLSVFYTRGLAEREKKKAPRRWVKLRVFGVRYPVLRKDEETSLAPDHCRLIG